MLDLPAEIIIQVCSYLSYRDLLACSLVCRLIHAVVRGNASCQYTIELAAAGMQDGPPSILCCADRLTMLNNSQAAWHTLQWSVAKEIRMLPGSLYEFCGGVLAQSTQRGGRGLVFRRIPSHYRGIEEQVWSLDLDVPLRDFTLDPAQDLLVLIVQPPAQPNLHTGRVEVSVHLRSLTSGKVHPLARSPVLAHEVDVHAVNLTFMLQIHSDHVAVHFVNREVAPSELVVWNWKTGETLLNTHGADLLAFAFLTERLILVGCFGDVAFNLQRPRLVVVDIESVKGTRTEFEQVGYLCAFLYPACYPWVHALSFLIRSDPCTGWTPHGSVRVPFSVGPGPRLYVVTIWVMHDEDGEEMMPIDLFVLSSTLLEHIGTVGDGEGGREFEWSEWGPEGTRMMAQAPHSHSWVCYVFGTRFSGMVGGGGAGDTRTLEVWDFNPVGVKRGGESVWQGTSVVSGQVFVGEVRTRLPCRIFRRQVTAGEHTEVMCGEDSVVLVDTRARQFRILTF